jgi:DNA-binding GntR family transcriptional regulator
MNQSEIEIPSLSDGSYEIVGERFRSGSLPSGKAGEIATELETRLVLGAYRFGETLSTKQMTQLFHASRQPVSAAISHLRAIGYVDIIPQVGCRVVSPSVAEIVDFFVAIGRMEGAIARFAAQRHRGDEAAKLEQMAGRKAPQDLDTVGGRADYIRNVNAFHLQIWNMARSPTLENRVGRLRNLCTFYLWQGAPRLVPKAAQQLNRERVEIAAAIAERDAEKAERLMAVHIEHKPVVSGVVGAIPVATSSGRDAQ